MEGYYVVRTYRAGDVGEKIKFWVPGPRPERVRRRDTRDVTRIEKKNRGQAVKVMARLIHANFQAGDILMGLDYDDAHLAKLGEDPRAAARHELEKALRRVGRAAKKAGVPLRWIAVTSDRDGDTGEAVRIHHHLLINREALPLFREKWKAGSVNWEALRKGQGDYTPVAVYLLQQVEAEPEERKYTSSRNLVRPAPKDRIAISGAVLRHPKGTELVCLHAGRPFEPQYIRYIYREWPIETRCAGLSIGKDALRFPH